MRRIRKEKLITTAMKAVVMDTGACAINYQTKEASENETTKEKN